MINLEAWLKKSLNSLESKQALLQNLAETHDFSTSMDGFIGGGLFLEPSIPKSFVSLVSPNNDISLNSNSWCAIGVSSSSGWERRSRSRRRRGIVGDGGGEVGFWRGGGGGRFLSVTFSTTVKGGEGEGIGEILGQNGEKGVESETVAFRGGDEKEMEEKSTKVREEKGKALNTVKHLWAGAVAAMVSR